MNNFLNNNCITENLVFLNKIFYDNNGDSCPTIVPLTTNTADFTQQLIIGNNRNACDSNCSCGCGSGSGCGCGSGCNCNCGCGDNCCDFDLCNAQFTVTNSCITVNSATLAATSPFDAANVTVDGFPVSSLTLENGRYIADLSGVMADITRCPCEPVDRHLCDGCGSCNDCPLPCDNDGHFFLAQVAGPWSFLISIVIEGYVSNGRRVADFKLCIKSRPDRPIIVNESTNFALNCVEIPCQSQGISPTLRFNFEACGVLLNPTLAIAPTNGAPQQNGCPAPTQLVLTTNIVLTPRINLQVVRPSLFALDAREVDVCCDDLGQCDECFIDSNACTTATSPCTTSPSACTTSTSPCTTAPSFACQCTDTNGFRF